MNSRRSATGIRAWLAAAAGGLAAALATTLVLAPAQWAAAAVSNASGGRVELAEASGSIWNGSATLVVAPGADRRDDRASLPGTLTWTLRPWGLLHATVDLTLQHTAALAAPLRIQAEADGRVRIGAASIRLPASILAGLGAPWNTVRPGGVLTLRTDGLEARAGRIQGALVGEWEYASSALTPVSPIGHYRLLLTGPYPGTQVDLQTVSGPLELTGSGTIDEGGRLRFDGIARALAATDPATRTQLTWLIALLGRTDGESAILRLGS
jgi:general secretion pathway protein N